MEQDIMTATDNLPDPPVIDLDPYDVSVLQDPYAFFEAVRDKAPVVEIEKYGVYAVGRHELAETVLTDVDRFTTLGGIGLADLRVPGSGARPPSAILEVEPPEHTEVRQALRGVLSPAVIATVRQRSAEEAEQMVKDALAKGDIDGIDDLAEPYVAKVFCETIGVKFEREATRAIAAMSFNYAGPKNELFEESVAAAQPYLAWWEEAASRENILPGSVADKLFEAEDAGMFEPGIAANIVRSFVRAGTDTTISGMSTLIARLAASPDQWRYLKENPNKIKSAYDEALRFESPFYVSYRVTMTDTELAGYKLKADRKIAVFFGAANRDPRRWPDPDNFSVDRPMAGAHLSFGRGHHACLGAMIARIEGEAMLAALVKHVGTMELTGEIAWNPNNHLRMPKNLPIRMTA